MIPSRIVDGAAPLRAPFPWFGGKSRVAHLVWERFGDVPLYVEPFAGSLAVLLGRPHAPGREVVNDLDCYLANFWRAVKAAPAAVAVHADWPINEADLQARHVWLVSEGRSIAERCKADPEFYDPRVAGWWLWGLCSWIGSGWCAERPALQLPRLDRAGVGVFTLDRRGDIRGEMDALTARLRRVKVACGEWSRVLSPAITTASNGTRTLTAVFLDPPYDGEGHAVEYAAGTGSVAADVRAWALENGSNPLLRIALCGYAGEHDDLQDAGWDVLPWKAKGGYGSQGTGRGRDNASRERIWFSPHCIPAVPAQGSIFDLQEEAA